MPKITLPIPETNESISRPVVMEILRRFFQLTNLPKETRIQYQGDAISVSQLGSTMDDRTETFARLPHSERVALDVSETIVNDSVLTTPVLRPDQRTFFTDNVLDIYMKPVYHRCEVRISIDLRTKDKASAKRWADALQANISRGYAEQIQEVTYHYPVPQEFIIILSELHRLRENNHPLNEDIGAYIRRCMTPKFSVIVNQAGNHPTFVIRETQLVTSGYLDFGQLVVKAEREDNGGSYRTNFEYVAHYDQCTNAVMQYPINIHNQILSDKYRPSEGVDDWRIKFKQAGLSTEVFTIMSDPYWFKVGGYPGLSVPHYDDWLPKYEPPSTLAIERFLIQVDEDNPRDILSLKEMGDYDLHPLAIAYLEEGYEGVGVLNGSVFRLEFFEKFNPTSDTKPFVDDELNVIASVDMLPTVQNHLVLYFITDPYALSPVAKELICKHGAFARLYLSIIMPRLWEQDRLPPLGPNGRISFFDWDKAVEEVRDYYRQMMTHNYMGVNHQGNFTIVANRRL